METVTLTDQYPPEGRGDLAASADLRHLAAAALSEAPGAGPALLALCEVAPLRAAVWLLSSEPAVRRDIPRAALTAAIGRIARACDSQEEEAMLALADLLLMYGDLLPAAPFAEAAGWLTPRLLSPVLDRHLEPLLARSPGTPELLRLAARAAIAAGRGRDADRLLIRLARLEPGSPGLRALLKARRALGGADLPAVRVALLGSFTLDNLAPYVEMECRGLGLEPHLHLGAFNGWERETVGAEPALFEFRPELVVLAVALEDVLPELDTDLDPERLVALGEAAVDRVVAAARRVVDGTGATVLVHGFHPARPEPAAGWRGSGAFRSGRIAVLNQRLAAALDALPRCLLLDVQQLLSQRESGAADDPKLRHLARIRLPDAVAALAARAYAQVIAPLRGLTRKCVVVDLDNTLWGGIVGEDGPHGIQLGDTAPGSEYVEFQRYLKALNRRGFLLAIASKNNPEDALQVLRGHEAMVLEESDFAAVRIGWEPKHESLRGIAQELNIGLDSLVFLDDNPSERALVRELLPEVLTPELPADPARYRELVEQLPELHQLTVTDEDRARADLYRVRRQREAAQRDAISLEAYYGSLDIEIDIAPTTEATLLRVHQLFQRTNQFNLTTRRYALAELRAMAADPACQLLAVRVRDRYGDHGLVCSALVRMEGDTWVIDSFLLSCRVIGFGVETALLARIAAAANAAGATRLIGEFRATEKNHPSADMYAAHGFVRLDSTDDVVRWQRETSSTAPLASPSWIRIARHET